MGNFTATIKTQYNGVCKHCRKSYNSGDMIHVTKNVQGALHQNCYLKLQTIKQHIEAPTIITKIVTRDITQAVDSKKDGEIAKLKRKVKELENQLLNAKDETLIYKKML